MHHLSRHLTRCSKQMPKGDSEALEAAAICRTLSAYAISILYIRCEPRRGVSPVRTMVTNVFLIKQMASQEDVSHLYSEYVANTSSASQAADRQLQAVATRRRSYKSAQSSQASAASIIQHDRKDCGKTQKPSAVNPLHPVL